MLYWITGGDFVRETVFNKILEQIAVANGATAEEVRENMRIAMVSALTNPNPTVQKMWNSIPRKGEQPTLEEFMDYLISKNLFQT